MKNEIFSLADHLCFELRELVFPLLGKSWSRGQAGRAVGGDTTFAIDEAAEAYVEQVLAKSPLPVAFYSEDRGLVTRRGAEWTIVVDPIDGTRPAAAGLVAACVSVAVARGTEDLRMNDVVYAVVQKIKERGVTRLAQHVQPECRYGEDR